MRFPSTGPRHRGIVGAIPCCILAVILPGCGIPRLRRAEPAPGLPDTFIGMTSPENSSRLTVDEFYRDPLLTCLIDAALVRNRELKILEQEVHVAANEILARSGAYLPLVSAGAAAGLDRASNRSLEGAALRVDEYVPGRLFDNPHGTFRTGVNLTWRLDIYRQLRDARDAAAQRYAFAIERRNFFATRLVADVAENYYRLMALDKRIENLDQIIALQEQSLKVAEARKEAARDTELAVLRFEAEVRRNRSEKLIVKQDIIEAENRINFLLNRFPQPVGRDCSGFFDLEINALGVGVPSELLRNRPDIRQAERDLAATGLDVRVARINFYPQLVLDAGVGLESFSPADLFIPQAVAGSVAGGLVGPLVNRRAIKAEYLTANARQLQAIYDYQRTVLNAFTEVVNRLTRVRNYSDSVAIKKQQLTSLESAVDVAENLFQFARTEYLDVLTAQRDLRDARASLIDTKEQQLIAIADAYQALGGGDLARNPTLAGFYTQIPYTHMVCDGDDFRSLSRFYYGSERYHKALEAALRGTTPHSDPLTVGDEITIPWVDQLDPALIDEDAGTASPLDPKPADESVIPPPLPPAISPGPFGQEGMEDQTLRPARADPGEPRPEPTPGG